jgi:hypothetical protein
MGSTTNNSVTIVPEKSRICQRLESKHTALHIYAICSTNSLRCRQFYYMRVAQVCLPSRRWQIHNFSDMIVAIFLGYNSIVPEYYYHIKYVL